MFPPNNCPFPTAPPHPINDNSNNFNLVNLDPPQPPNSLFLQDYTHTPNPTAKQVFEERFAPVPQHSVFPVNHHIPLQPQPSPYNQLPPAFNNEFDMPVLNNNHYSSFPQQSNKHDQHLPQNQQGFNTRQNEYFEFPSTPTNFIPPQHNTLQPPDYDELASRFAALKRRDP